MNYKVSKIADEILDGWYGPTGKCWCDKLKMLVSPETCPKKCPECEPLRSQDTKQFRYLHLHDDFKAL